MAFAESFYLQFDHSLPFEQLEPYYQHDEDAQHLVRVVTARLKQARWSYDEWAKQRDKKRGLKDRLFSRKKSKDMKLGDARVVRCLGRYNTIETVRCNIPLALDSTTGRSRDEIKSTYYAFAEQLQLLNQLILQPIEQAKQMNANDILGGPEGLVQAALSIYHKVVVILEQVYIQLRRCWKPQTLSRPFCPLALSIQENPKYNFTPLEVEPGSGYSSKDWWQCPKCSGVVEKFYRLGEGYQPYVAFVWHLKATEPLEKVPITCPDCKKEFPGVGRLDSHRFQTDWDSRVCSSPPARLQVPSYYPSPPNNF
ncbi:hypothetical protein L207DRAFT_189657 [Hyaloscypha variabilis F]|uniref:C2H2-type domain-containing protein n=1 Tax=Hyaloscypha variabilis (strain UAMH 11265 / GT02V1 / F) TaxID=1149755 RepID=A0A2J6QZ64_HYAVF|nr:hypothetical protein L207DRAFT_189657 [Hyaloscypha variabilis F]